MHLALRSIMFASVLGCAAAASAETLRVTAFVPAKSDEAAALQSIAVAPFGGDYGEELAIRVEDTLRGVSVDGVAYFRIVPVETGGRGEGLLRGTAQSEVRITDYTENRTRCIKDAEGKCTTQNETYTVKCKRRSITLVVTMRLTGPDGRLLWADDRPESTQDTWCEDKEGGFEPKGAVVRTLIPKVAQRVRYEFAPHYSAMDMRVDEGRRNLSKEDGKLFKDAVKLTKSNAAAACDQWRRLGQGNPGHVPTQFNIALCSESAGDYAGAEAQYRRVLMLEPNNGATNSALNRIAGRERAEAQLRAHNAP